MLGNDEGHGGVFHVGKLYLRRIAHVVTLQLEGSLQRQDEVTEVVVAVLSFAGPVVLCIALLSTAAGIGCES